MPSEFANYPKDLYPYVGLIVADTFVRNAETVPRTPRSQYAAGRAFWARGSWRSSATRRWRRCEKAEFGEPRAAAYSRVLTKRRDGRAAGRNGESAGELSGSNGPYTENAAVAAPPDATGSPGPADNPPT